MEKIDFHAHYLTPSYRAFLSETLGLDSPAWSVDEQLALNAENGIVYSLMGISTPYFCCGDAAKTLLAVKENNDEIARLVKGYEKCLGFLAALPLPDIEQSVDEIERAIALGARGFTLVTNAEGLYLGDLTLAPVMERFNAHSAVVTVHPTTPSAVPRGVLDGFRVQALEFFFDTTRTFVNMTRNHVFRDYPNIRWIFPHSGALIPAVSDRVPSSFRAEGNDADLFSDLSRVYFDLAGPAEPKLINLLKMVAPIEHFLYGSDFPYAKAADVAKYRRILEETNKLTAEEKEMMFYTNGAGLLGL